MYKLLFFICALHISFANQLYAATDTEKSSYYETAKSLATGSVAAFATCGIIKATIDFLNNSHVIKIMHQDISLYQPLRDKAWLENFKHTLQGHGENRASLSEAYSKEGEKLSKILAAYDDYIDNATTSIKTSVENQVIAGFVGVVCVVVLGIAVKKLYDKFNEKKQSQSQQLAVSY